MKTRIIFGLLIFTLSFGIKGAFATNFTWNNTSGDNNWSTAANWSGGASGTYPGSTSGQTDNVTFSASGTINYTGSGIVGSIGTISTTNSNTINLTAAFTTTGLVTANQDLTLTGGSTFTANSMTTGQHALTINTPLKVTNTFTISGSVVTSNSSGTINAGTMAITTNGNTFTLKAIVNVTNMSIGGNASLAFSNTGYTGAATNITGALTLNMTSSATGNAVNFTTPLAIGTIASATSGSYTVITNTLATSAANLSVTNGNVQIGSSGVSTAVTISNATTSATAGTLTLYNGALTTSTLALSGLLSIYNSNTYTTNSNTITSTGSANTISGGITFQNINYGLTFLGAGTTTITGAIAMGSGNDMITVGSSSSTSTIVNFGAGTALTSSGNTGGGITNYGKLNFNGTATSGVTLTYSTPGTTINNITSGSVMTAPYTTFKFNNNTSSITNAGTFTGNNLSVTFADASSNITNSGNFTVSAFNLTASSGSTNFSIVNSGNFQADGNSSINFQGAPNNITNSGNFIAGTSNSACAVNISGSNSSGITNVGYFIVGSTSVMSVTSSSATITNSGYFTLMSDAYGSATVNKITSGSVFKGTYNVQRYLTGNNSLAYRGYRLLSSPVNATSYTSSTTGANYIDLSNLKTTYTVLGTNYYGAATGGPSGGGFFIANANPTIYFYNEPTLTSGNSTFLAGKNVGVMSISSPALSLSSTQYGTHTVSVPVGNGYIMYFIGSTNKHPTGSTAIAPDNTTMTYPGYLNQQDVKTFLWYTPNAGASAGTAGNLSITSKAALTGFNMVGNPYASIIDLKQVYTDNSSSTGYTTFWELTDLGQSYVSYNAYSGATSSSTYSSQYVASGQGFMVQATASGQSLTFKEDQKVYNSTPVLSGTTTPPILLSLRKSVTTTKSDALIEPSNTLDGLHLRMSIDTATYTECGIYFSSKWSDSLDNNDAIDIGGVAPKMYFSSLTTDGYQVGINSLGAYTKGKRVKLYVKGTADGTFSLGMADIQNIDTAMFHVYLVDNLKKDSVDLVSTKSYAFTITNADTTTYGSNRFVLAIERKALAPYQLLSFTAQKTSDGVLLTWKTANEGTYTGFSIDKQDGTQYNTLYNIQSTGAGVYTYTDHNPVTGTNTYRLGQNDIDSVETYSKLVSVVYSAAGSSNILSVYPNPAKDQITVSFNGATSGSPTYTASIFNSTGLMIGQKTVSGNSWSEDVSNYRPGAYILEVRAGNGSLVGNTKFTKYQ